VKFVEAQAVRGECIERRPADRPAERLRPAEADIVDAGATAQDQLRP
jgi:hypothetical protein